MGRSILVWWSYTRLCWRDTTGTIYYEDVEWYSFWAMFLLRDAVERVIAETGTYIFLVCERALRFEYCRWSESRWFFWSRKFRSYNNSMYFLIFVDSMVITVISEVGVLCYLCGGIIFQCMDATCVGLVLHRYAKMHMDGLWIKMICPEKKKVRNIKWED